VANYIDVGEDPFPAQPLPTSHSSPEATPGAYAYYGWHLRIGVSPRGGFRQTDELPAKTNRAPVRISIKHISLDTTIVNQVTNPRAIMVPLRAHTSRVDPPPLV
jgi:hypothetical protein